MAEGEKPGRALGLRSVSMTHPPESALSPLQLQLFSAACLRWDERKREEGNKKLTDPCGFQTQWHPQQTLG